MPSRNPQELAKMLNDYADQMTKFVLLQALAFLISLSNKAMLDTISTVPWLVTAIIWESINCLEFMFVFTCHLGEDQLQGKPTPDDPTSFWRRFIRVSRCTIIIATDLIMLAAITILQLHRR